MAIFIGFSSPDVTVSHHAYLTLRCCPASAGGRDRVKMKILRILLADDHELIRRGVKALLQTHPGWVVCGEARTGREAVTRAQELKPDVVVLDISMPDLNGIDAAKRIRKVSPGIEVLIFSEHYSERLILDAVVAGVRGYVVKSDSERELALAVEALANHQPFFTARATQTILTNICTRKSQTDSIEPAVDGLTSHEREIVELVADGKSSTDIASIFGVSVKMVESQRAFILRKLQIRTSAQLVRYALRNEIINP